MESKGKLEEAQRNVYTAISALYEARREFDAALGGETNHVARVVHLAMDIAAHDLLTVQREIDEFRILIGGE